MNLLPQNIWLVCGVPGSGKTWVCEQLQDRFHYVAHDQYIAPKALKESPIGRHKAALIKAALKEVKPIIGEVPFMMSIMINELRAAGMTVHPVFVLENEGTVRTRYEKREKKPIPKQHITRIKTVGLRAKEYGFFSGTSEEVLRYLKAKF